MEAHTILWSARLRGTDASEVRMSTAFFPGWTVRVDGKETPFGPSETEGLISYLVPAGVHQITVAWEPTGTTRLSRAISLASLALLVAMALGKRRLFAEPSHGDEPERVERSVE